MEVQTVRAHVSGHVNARVSDHLQEQPILVTSNKSFSAADVLCRTIHSLDIEK